MTTDKVFEEVMKGWVNRLRGNMSAEQKAAYVNVLRTLLHMRIDSERKYRGRYQMLLPAVKLCDKQKGY